MIAEDCKGVPGPGAPLELELEELTYVSLNTLDDITKTRIRASSSLDVLLCDFFFQFLWENAEQYGLERLNREVALLRGQEVQRLLGVAEIKEKKGYVFLISAQGNGVCTGTVFQLVQDYKQAPFLFRNCLFR